MHNDHERRGRHGTAKTYRLRSTSIIICRCDDAGRERDGGGRGGNQVGGIYVPDQNYSKKKPHLFKDGSEVDRLRGRRGAK